MNTSTKLTLNDRFSMIKQSNGTLPKQRGRSRSRSQPRPSRQLSQGGVRRNRILLDQLEKQHKMRVAMKLKNRSIMRSRGVRSQNITKGRNNNLLAVVKRKLVEESLNRGSNLTTFIPLNDGPRRNFRGRSRSRSQSRTNTRRSRSQSRNRNQQQKQGSIIDRLGFRQPSRRMRRTTANNGSQQPQQRSRSRVRLNRNNFNQSNSNNQGPLRRAKQLQSTYNDGVALLNQLRRFAMNLPSNRNNQLNRPLRGRVVKRNQNKQNGNVGGRIQRKLRQNPKLIDGNKRRGRIVKRNVQPQARGRALNRAPVNRMQANQRNGQGNGRRGRSRTRRGANNANNTRGNGGKPQISKEALDKQLDDYMSKGSA